MKTRNNINIRSRNTYSTFTFICIFALSCSKDNDSSENTVTIIPRAIAIENYNDQKTKLSTSKRASNQINATSSLIGTAYFDDIAADISINKESERLTNFSLNQKMNEQSSKNSASLNASNEMILPSTYYRFMLFQNNQNWNSWAATWTISGYTSNKVTTDGNTTYRWYAASYNETNPLPTLLYDQITMPINDVTTEFMAASGTIITSSKDNYLNFTFQRKTAALTFIFDARKMKCKISEISLSPVGNTILKGGTFNLVTNQVESIYAPTISTLDNTKWKNYSNSTGDSVKVASFYTLGTDDIANFEIQLNSLILENNSDVHNPIVHAYIDKKIRLPVTIRPIAGQRNTFTITLNKL
ncbi:hypothetical protein [Sphingobacterium hungaricum]|uniref:Fimbrillin-like n=1 Tax=Sphingobacterium hungaricum TaxID=2082723 RepID=A0A928UW91_9SPHI|nr:hypothetical protein [Sphingobacterium hungaricum]MBE8712671.1 hypothetical protein [Sphingobacterium hungaricum]